MGASLTKLATEAPSFRIDVHHHILPPELHKEKFDPTIGWRTPPENLPWSPEISLKAMEELGIGFSFLSLPALSSGFYVDDRNLARKWNEEMRDVCERYPKKFGWFASLPMMDVKAAEEELIYALDNLKADGIAMSSSYGKGAEAKYIADDKFDHIWEALNDRGALVFLHGTQTPSSIPFPSPFLGVPVTEVPNETFKAAAHLVVSGKKARSPNVRIILAHLGGSLPALAARVAVLSPHMGCPMTPEDILAGFGEFWYESALSGFGPVLEGLERFAGSEQMLFGTDFPAVSKGMIKWFNHNLELYLRTNPCKTKKIMHENIMSLVPRLHRL